MAQLRGRYRDFPVLSCPLHTHSLPHYPHHSPEWYICYNEPTLTHHYHPDYLIYIRVHSWCYTLYGLRQIYNDSIYHYNVI